jgi:hypothetical protein
MTPEHVYLDHDNTIDLILKADGVAVSLASVTKISLAVGSVLIESTNQAADPIQWAKSGYATGEVRIAIGGVSGLVAGVRYDAPLIVYDSTNDDGIVWELIPLLVHDVSAPA